MPFSRARAPFYIETVRIWCFSREKPPDLKRTDDFSSRLNRNASVEHCTLQNVTAAEVFRPLGLHEIQCSLPVENRRIFLNELSEVSFSECKFSLSLTDLFIIIFSGVAVSIAAILSSFFLATLVHCFQRCAPSKDDDDDEDNSED
ncbi:leucine-rich repeat-containing protein 38 isoform X2 [Melanerpes formicivorus]|uniref:leucine-rich repeat-containing protein 38 isoform X2 n=1 Tax=Melanerpes formicivorus TaxID=211600 RepID=UPI00358E5402